MPQLKQVITIFLASPGDVLRERDCVREVIADLDRTIAKPKGMGLRAVSWEENAHPAYGQDPQAAINSQIAEMSQYDLFVGILWNRIGTATPRAASGTIEEFDIASQSLASHGKPEIWLYFSERKANLKTGEQLEQKSQVVEFRKRVEAKGLVWAYETLREFRDKFRDHLSMWLENCASASTASPERRSHRAQQKRASQGSAEDTVRVNGYKLFYFRANHKLTFTGLAQVSGVDRTIIRKLEKVNQEMAALETSCFSSCDHHALEHLEEALGCRGKLEAGKPDDFLTQYIQFYKTYKGSSPTSQRANDRTPVAFETKAVVFDFDGTLTRTQDQRTTWEMIWVSLGYSINDCANLHRRFQRKEFNHPTWCDLTRDAFRARSFTLAQLESIARATSLVDGVRETVQTLRKSGAKLFILSGSIKAIIQYVLCDLQTEFEEIKANEILFDSSGVISEIKGTPFDFKGKADFLKRVVKEWQMDPLDVLFVGNSCNDVFASQSGVRTLCVNPRFTDPDNEEHWTYAIREMSNLREILNFVKV